MEQHIMNMFASNSINIPSSSLAVFSEEPMNPMIWRRLPRNLVDRVLAFLPPPAFFRLRSVCKRWYALLFSNNFHQHHLSISPPRHWFLFFKRKTENGHIYNTNTSTSSHGNEIPEGYLYDPSERRWYRLTFPSWMSEFTPAASSGGLIAWVSDQGGFKHVVVSNPFLKSLALPPTTIQRLCPSVGLFTIDLVFCVMLAGDDMVSPYSVKNLSAECLNTFQGVSRSQLPDLTDLSERMVFVEGKFYCMSYKPFKVVAYDIPNSTWTVMDPPMIRYILSPCLLEFGGRLFIIAAVKKCIISEPKSVRLWEFRPGHSKPWLETMKMPQQIYDEFSRVENGNGFECVVHGAFMVFTFSTSDRILLFDLLSQNSWQWIPACPYLYPCGGARLRAFAYDPRLSTPALELLETFSEVVHLTHPLVNQLRQSYLQS